MIRVAINGCGRIGRRLINLISNIEDLELIAVNDLANIETISHLIKYDSVHGTPKFDIYTDKSSIIINGNKINFYQEKNPENLPWKDLKIDIVIECTGLFKTYELAYKHIKSGAKRVILSAPPADNSIKTVVLGINDHIINDNELIISNASCTTNSAAPMIKVIDENFNIESAYITTIHSYTSDQRLHDAPHSDLRRARAAAQSIIPTTTGAAKALTKIFPNLNDKLGGCGIRVPVPNGSLTDITFIVKKDTSVEEINQLFKKSSSTSLNGILEYTNDPIVSIDIIGNPYSCIFDSKLTSVIGKMVKIVGWYDNEMGYSHRIIDLIRKLKS